MASLTHPEDYYTAVRPSVRSYASNSFSICRSVTIECLFPAIRIISCRSDAPATPMPPWNRRASADASENDGDVAAGGRYMCRGRRAFSHCLLTAPLSSVRFNDSSDDAGLPRGGWSEQYMPFLHRFNHFVRQCQCDVIIIPCFSSKSD